MAKRIFPGNFVSNLKSHDGGQGVVAVPGRVYYRKIGYALVDSTGGTEFDVIIPSPDMRGDDKVRENITGMTIPAGAVVYSVGLRVSDTRKNKDAGSATSGLSGTNGDTIALKDADNSAADTISTTVVSTPTIAVSGGTIAPTSAKNGVVTGSVLAGAETLKVFVRDSGGTGTGSTLSSTATGGTPIICEVSYYLDDAVATVEDTRIPYTTES